jgi:hypothetical protein
MPSSLSSVFGRSARLLSPLALGGLALGGCGGGASSSSSNEAGTSLDGTAEASEDASTVTQDAAPADAGFDRVLPSTDGGADAATADAGGDGTTVADAGTDAAADTGADAGTDAGAEAGTDAATDAQTAIEAGPCVPDCTNAACGGSDHCGGICSTGTCGAGLECMSGSCACTANSCASGCCDQGGCEPGSSSSACGSAGGTCAVCSGSSPSCLSGSCCIATTTIDTSSWTLSPNLVIDLATTTHYTCDWLVDNHTYDYTTCDGWISDVFISTGGSAVVGWNLVTNAMYTQQWNGNPYSPSIATSAAQWAVATTFPGGDLSNLSIE